MEPRIQGFQRRSLKVGETQRDRRGTQRDRRGKKRTTCWVLESDGGGLTEAAGIEPIYLHRTDLMCLFLGEH